MALLQQSPSSSSSFFSSGFTYDVFLNFRGTDTRFSFTGNLYKALSDRAIRTFIDHSELQGGDEIIPSLANAIEDSRIFIPVFSINYASSSFCLDELVHIIHCFKAKGRLVLPVFYDVDPSLVRHQTGSYGKAIAKHKKRFQNNKEKYIDNNMERLHKWKMALNQAANLSGYHFNPRKEYEYEFIEKIVQVVHSKINRALLHVADYPVGLESRVLQVISLLDVGSDDGVCMIGIYGIGGIGKTTLARAIYKFIADQFEELCFLHNVREDSTKHGLQHLQEKLLSKTIGLHIKLGDVSEGISIIRQRLHRKKVLLILDDVDELKQLQVMAGGLDWFGLGSRVIITTRDKHLLAWLGIERTYEVDGLNEKQALELLIWKAFKNNKIDSNYEDILNRAATYACGLPLALEVVGSNLFGKPIEEWKSTLDWCEKIPDKKIQAILKVSFDALEEIEQSVFLDIACCFNGYRLAEVEDILYAHHGQCMKYHIGVLVEKSLIKISKWQLTYYVTLHDLIEDMGREIVRQESLKEHGKRSRLWFHEDIVQLLEENTGTNRIEIIHLDFQSFEEEEVVEWKGDEFKKMKNLKTLIIKNGRFFKGPEHLPNSLRVLEWPRYPSSDIPSDFYPKKLFICKLRESCLTSFEFPRSSKRFGNMRELNLDNCPCLTRILDLSGLPNLEIFSFENCENLITIHDSVGFLNKLKILDAKGCSKLRRFPPMKLTSLQDLELSNCISLESFPEILGEMKNITKLDMKGTSIEELPFSFLNLTGLCELEIWGSGTLMLPSSISMMPNLLWINVEDCRLLPKENDKLGSMVSSNVSALRLSQCYLSDEFLPTVLTWFANVQELDLTWSKFTILPECLKECGFLSDLILDNCKCLREIRGIPPNLKNLSALHCESLTSSCRSMLLNQELHEAGGTTFILPGSGGIPEWFEHQSRGPSISFWFRNNLPSISFFFASKLMRNKCPNSEDLPLAAYLNMDDYKCVLCYPILGINDLINREPDHTYLHDVELRPKFEFGFEFDWEKYKEIESKLEEALLENEWTHVEVRCEGSVVESLLIEMGIHVVKQKSSMADIQFTDPYKKRELDDHDCHY